ncbi:MAG TPA: hypothetical protein ENK74_01305 [Nitratifractor sp.]|nr:hypothetical protein [Nitratifractor sp.]
MWKKILIGVVAFFAIVIALVMYGTSGMTDTVDSFLQSVSEQNYNKAYNYLSDDFTKSTSKEQLIAFVKSSGLDKYKSASWGNRSFEGKRGEIEGTIETQNGGAIPLKVKFTKLSDGSWRIYAIEKAQSGVQVEKETQKNKVAKTAPSSTPKKSDADIEALVKDTILHFAVSVNKKDMSFLRDSASNRFKEAVTLEAANKGFQSFMDMNIDFTILDKMEPIIDSQEKKSDGRLVLNGHYETKPNKFYFVIHYIKESGTWKLIALDINIE